jgi:hypothetical protein
MNRGSAAALAACVLASPAIAGLTSFGPSTYASEADSPFFGVTGFQVETFEDGLLNIPGVTASGGGVVAPGASTDSVDGDDGVLDGSGAAGRSWYSFNGGSRVEFTFDASAIGQLPQYAGLVLTDVGIVAGGAEGFSNATFFAYDSGGMLAATIGPSSFGDGLVTGATAEDRFFGVFIAGGISRIAIEVASSTDWELDHVQYAVPTPGAGLLAGVAALMCLPRRRPR